MGEARNRGNFEQRKQKSMDEKQKQQMEVGEAGARMADLVNEIVHKGVPIPFIVASMELIKHDLCNQHIALSKQMREIAKGNVQPNFEAPKPASGEVPKTNDE